MRWSGFCRKPHCSQFKLLLSIKPLSASASFEFVIDVNAMRRVKDTHIHLSCSNDSGCQSFGYSRHIRFACDSKTRTNIKSNYQSTFSVEPICPCLLCSVTTQFFSTSLLSHYLHVNKLVLSIYLL